MNPRIERSYYGSPVWLQNLAVTAFGYSLRRQRSGAEANACLRQLQESQWWPAATMQAYVDAQLRETLAHAFRHVPYYRRLAAHARLQPTDVRSVADLCQLPLLEKEQVRHAPNDFVCDRDVLGQRVFRLSTSGTTGTPLTITCDPASRRRHYAFWSRLRSWFGIGPSDLRATFFGRIICSPQQQQPPFWRYDYFQRNYLFSSYHLSNQHLGSYADALRRLQPPEIIGYPSSIFALARYLVEKDITDIRPRVIFTTAETLLAYQREAIERAFGAPVVDQYGCTEMAFYVSQCEHGSYHVHPEHGIVEVVGPDGAPVPPGTVGEAVCTGLVNRAMPLIRYRLGDRIALKNGGCSCGRSFPLLAEIAGRMDDVLMTPSGRPLGRLDPVFKPLKGIRATQIIQSSLDRLLVRIVVDNTFSNRDLESLRYELAKRAGDEMTIEFDFVSEIPKDPNGKLRAVVSKVRM